ncbi:BON domain-containing protein [Burkholderia sp. LA-2-3-30-S1-D2]|uniref:BON domain-containing protein n=1 Tax=Burkholderia sp. LA-2-3-30-S1-D2 TaxID=1637862 RepID=UPI0007559570|nr:BON domain-containing protein [Burkholderia sp. LA-2-3-30-S1-D2]AOI99751.1 OsmY domain-containing protein [Burkholderia sp. LA-2-3-30-S1-D2]KVE15463.1 OsmY domain-containing protein [Burkholderia sp. LA-2-3-30-S1-D2]
MKSDSELKKDVEQELEWDPSIDAVRIGVEVHERVVTLTGHVASYLEKVAVRKAVERIEGVRGIVLELEVQTDDGKRRSDEDVAIAARSLLMWDAGLGEQAVHVTVENGCVTLSGEVMWSYQMQEAERAVERLRGVTRIINEIHVRPHPTQSDIAGKIQAALIRHATEEAAHVGITVQDGCVTLTGEVGSLSERRLAFDAAWSAPGVRDVVDQLTVA